MRRCWCIKLPQMQGNKSAVEKTIKSTENSTVYFISIKVVGLEALPGSYRHRGGGPASVLFIPSQVARSPSCFMWIIQCNRILSNLFPPPLSRWGNFSTEYIPRTISSPALFFPAGSATSSFCHCSSFADYEAAARLFFGAASLTPLGTLHWVWNGISLSFMLLCIYAISARPASAAKHLSALCVGCYWSLQTYWYHARYPLLFWWNFNEFTGQLKKKNQQDVLFIQTLPSAVNEGLW